MYAFTADAIPPDWRALLGNYFDTAQWLSLQSRLQAEVNLGGNLVRPDPENFFKALTLTPVAEVKAVILGQDPYHSPGIAQGLAFSIPQQIPKNSRQFPSSLRNISKALALEGFGVLPHGDLHIWAKQGVLLLNTALSVKLGEAGSHTSLGWKSLIERLIGALAEHKPNLVWMLWGAHAQAKLPLISSGINQLILQASHPSGLGVYKTHQPFLEVGDKASCNHFTKTNQWLSEHGMTPIDWVEKR
ncbi:Uracil-DNA glycosylase [Polynucleobacter meluiroseus]|uniref:Uracil-DNA glycosylase n=1 Tax=Polynucleobacter meluiroseus TaxID=1938814 RepID=A0A240E135_9BURK|nr:uracil-DNA glycosylase [Polynucleobacter meluiroseus]SNX28937.1 Uracil-DNA glycosylase [Polynucleobacter meluiroseus]